MQRNLALRYVLPLVLAVAGAAVAQPAAQAKPQTQGCWLQASGGSAPPSTKGLKLYKSTGNPNEDQLLNKALNRMWKASNQSPAFAMYDDAGSPNALASDESYQGRRGLILFGKAKYEKLKKDYVNWDIAVLAIIAHEIAHIAQFNEMIYGQTSFHSALKSDADGKVVFTELHANYLAGYYLGTLSLEVKGIRDAGTSMLFEAIASINPDAVDFHGTDRQRRAAFLAGNALGKQGALKFQGALKRGMDYITQDLTGGEVDGCKVAMYCQGDRPF
jgi:hypothetical protein